jgi:ATP-dependent protease Clp ATPase subunit
MLEHMYEIPGRTELTEMTITEEMISEAGDGSFPYTETTAESA